MVRIEGYGECTILFDGMDEEEQMNFRGPYCSMGMGHGKGNGSWGFTTFQLSTLYPDHLGS